MEATNQIKPLRDLVLLELHEAAEVTSSGIIMPTGTKKYDMATVVVCGKGTPFYTMKLVPGDVVRFRDGAGIAIVKDGKAHLLLRELECCEVQE